MDRCRDGSTNHKEKVAEMASTTDPVRDGRFWLWPDGTRLPVVSGGDGDESTETDDDGEDNDDGDNNTSETGGGRNRSGVIDVAKLQRALKKANREAAAQRKRAEALEASANDADNADQSQLDKLQSTIDGLRGDLAKEQRKTTIAEIAREKGLTPAQAKRLTGDTREELEEDADELLEAFGGSKSAKDTSNDDDRNDDADGGDDKGSGDDKGDKGETDKGKPPASTGKPKEKLRSGASSDGEPEPDANEIAEKVLKNRIII